MQNVETQSPTLFRLQDNLLAHQTSSGELAVRAGAVLLYIEGPPSVVVDLLEHIDSKGAVSFEEVLNTSGLFQGTEETEAAGQLWSYLVDNRILVPEEPDKQVRRDCEVVLLTTGAERAGYMRYLDSVLDDLGIQHTQQVIMDDLADTDSLRVGLDKPRRLTVVDALGEYDLYRLNRRMLARNEAWCYFETLAVSSFVSPIIGQAGSPCYECIRLRRVGALPDLAASAVFEAKLKNEPPAFQTLAKKDPSLDLSVSALLIDRIVEWVGGTRTGRKIGHYIGRSGAIRPGTVFAVPNCLACRQAGQGA